jgi:glycogenin glucosyltransferase
LELNKVYVESAALIAAAPDVLPPHFFNSGVMVVRPSTSVFQSMQQHASLLTTFDGSDTGFLNAYFNTWFTDFPPQARLAAGYNAQQVMYDVTTDQNNTSSNFWDVQVGFDLYIVHYSNDIKPWETKSTSTSSSSLQVLWNMWHQKSKNFLLRWQKERKNQQRLQQGAEEQQKRTNASSATAKAPSSPSIHKLISNRFKELRVRGKSTQDAMRQAREELQPDEPNLDVGSQVAAMFGMR